MEKFFLHLALLFPAVILILFLYKRKSAGLNRFPPGRRGWPIVGETWDLHLAGQRGTPEKFITDRMAEHSSDVFKTSLLGETMAVFCGASGNKFLFSNENKYVTSWWPKSMGKLVTHTENIQDETKKVRSIMIEFLRPEGLQNYVPIMDSKAKEHLETNWSPCKEVKVFPLVKQYTFALACNLFMNIKDPKHLQRLADPFTFIAAGIISLPINFPGTAFSRASKAVKVIREELLEIIKQRKRQLQENKEPTTTDMLTRLLLRLDESNDNATREMEIYMSLIGLLIAGYDTLSTTITFFMYYLADHPHVYRKVFEEQMEVARSKRPGELLKWDDIQKMKYSWCVACEAMRLSPPAPGAFREAITDFTYAGFTIPKGWKTYWTTHSTHKDPKYFPDPEKFDPSRFEGSGPTPFSFVPFGGGPRMCAGKEYARLAILAFIHNVVTKFKFQKSIHDEKIIYKPNPVPAYDLLVQLEFVDKPDVANVN